MDYFDFGLIYAPQQLAFDGSGGHSPDLDEWLEDYNQEREGYPPEWVVDAYQDLIEQVLQDPEIAAIVERYQDQILSESAQNVVENQIRFEVVQNAQNGDYDDFVERVEAYAESSGAWSDSNGFDDPYLDWNYDLNDHFWRNDGPTWWGDEYGLY